MPPDMVTKQTENERSEFLMCVVRFSVETSSDKRPQAEMGMNI
jgi:hypothetical protein